MSTTSTSRTITVEINGTTYERDVPASRLLVHFLRDDLDLTGTHVGCDTGSCGACTVQLGGDAVKSCCLLAVQADGASITTVEGLAGDDGELTPLQQSFSEHHALQCGYCTPGMLMSATALLEQNPRPSEHEVKVALQGNICRCTGYWNIVEAVVAAGEGGGRDDRVETEAGTLQKGAAWGRACPGRRTAGSSRARASSSTTSSARAWATSTSCARRTPTRRIDVDRRLGGTRAARRLRDAHRRRGGDPDRSLLPDRGAAGRAREGLRARGRQGALPRRSRSSRSSPRRRELARDAAELVMVDYEPLDAVVDARAALAEGAPVLHEECGGNLSYSGVWEWGDVEAAFAEADHVVTIDELHFDRFNSTPLECDGALVEYNRGTGAVDDVHEQPVPGLRGDHDGPGDARRRSTSCASSRRTSAAASATRSRRTRSSSSAACSRASSSGRSSGRSGAPTSTSRCRTATSAGSRVRRSPSRPTARCSGSARRRSTTQAPTSATSRSAASSGRRSRPGCTSGATSGSSSRRR